jgi:glycogen debranching enzyme
MFMLTPRPSFDLYIEIGVDDGHTPSRERLATPRRPGPDRHAQAPPARGAAAAAPAGCSTTGWSKSRADLALLTTEIATGPYPYAGIPWFSTAFGRDAIITAWQVLWIEPSLAKGVLRYLAEHQAHEARPSATARPARSCMRPARAR